MLNAHDDVINVNRVSQVVKQIQVDIFLEEVDPE